MKTIKPRDFIFESTEEPDEICLKLNDCNGEDFAIIFDKEIYANIFKGFILSIAQCPNNDINQLINLIYPISVNISPLKDSKNIGITLEYQIGLNAQFILNRDKAHMLLMELQASLGDITIH